MATILYDNDSPHVSFLPPESSLRAISDIFLGRTMTAGSTLTITFNGISITLVGSLFQRAIVAIDGETRPGPSTGDVIPGVFYQSPVLIDNMHNLTMTLHINNPDIQLDYATVTAGKNTPLQGERLIVDGSDPSVVFEGNWRENTNPVLIGEGGKRLAYANTTHETSSFNASATFHFNGTTVSVFGICSGPDTVFLTIELDGELSTNPFLFQNSSNFQWYHKEGLSSTNHTLKMTYIGGFNHSAFTLDYIIYTPSFTSPPEGPSSTASSSQPSATNTTVASPIITTLPPDHSGISRAKLLGAVIAPVVFGVIVILMLLVMQKKKLLFWSTRKRRNTVNPFPPPHPSPQDLSQLRVHHKSSLTNGQTVVESPILDEDLPLFDPSTTRRRWWAWHWRRSGSGTVEAFPPNWDPSSSRQPIARHKPALPTWHVTQQRASRQSDAGSAHETIVEDPRVQELEDMVLALQQEIEETRGQDRSGAQNGALMRELVTNRSETSNERERRDQGDGGSVAVSTTVV